VEGRVNAPTVEAVEDKDALIRAVQIWDTAILRVEGSDGLESAKLLTPLLKLAEVYVHLPTHVTPCSLTLSRPLARAQWPTHTCPHW
jgi:hypothetical protein